MIAHRAAARRTVSVAAGGAHRGGDAAGDVQRGVQGLAVADREHSVRRASAACRRPHVRRAAPVNAVCADPHAAELDRLGAGAAQLLDDVEQVLGAELAAAGR